MTLGNEERRELLRASQGRTPHGTISRVGNAQQALLEHLVGTPGNRLTTAQLAERTGRLKHNVRASLRRLLGYNLVVEVNTDEYALPADFWDRWHGVLVDSGVLKSENLTRRRHENDRLARGGWVQWWEQGEESWVYESTGERVSRADALARVVAEEGI